MHFMLLYVHCVSPTSVSLWERPAWLCVSIRPFPLIDLGLIDAVLVGVVLALDLHITQYLLGVGAGSLQGGYAVDDVDGDAEAVDLILDGQIERRVDVALFFVAAHVQVVVIGAPVGQAMNEPGIAME